jgi:hypothetical protein
MCYLANGTGLLNTELKTKPNHEQATLVKLAAGGHVRLSSAFYAVRLSSRITQSVWSQMFQFYYIFIFQMYLR